jgi:hypothetical protein
MKTLQKCTFRLFFHERTLTLIQLKIFKKYTDIKDDFNTFFAKCGILIEGPVSDTS